MTLRRYKATLTHIQVPTGWEPLLDMVVADGEQVYLVEEVDAERALSAVTVCRKCGDQYETTFRYGVIGHHVYAVNADDPTTEIDALKHEVAALRQQVETLKQQLEYTAEAFTKASHHCINMDIQIGGLNGNRTYDETYKALLDLKQQLAQAQAARTICDVHQAEFDQLAQQVADLTEQLAQAQAEIEDWRKKKKGKP